MINNIRKSTSIASLIYSLFVYSAKYKNRSILFKRFWNFYWLKSCDFFLCPVNFVIHGKEVIFNYGYTYPLLTREVPTYNDPLIELVYQTYKEKKSPVDFIDVGAAVGDTILLVLSSCPGMVNKFYCIDGDQDFFSFLESNLGNYNNGQFINAILSSADGFEKELVKIHPGTSSLQGLNTVRAITLDSVIEGEIKKGADILKIDVDGFDGRVLKGAVNSLKKYTPKIIFEWHPLLCQKTNNNWLDHFAVLVECGYEKFVWFDNYGNFRHVTTGLDVNSIEVLANACINRQIRRADYFDVIALHGNSRIPIDELVGLGYARVNKFAC